MNENISVPHHRSVGHRRRPCRVLALAALLSLIIGAIGLAIETPIKLARAAFDNETATAEPVRTYPTRVIPKEWRGYREPVEYKYMYRTDPTPRLDWIR